MPILFREGSDLMGQDFPQTGDIAYLMHKAVIIKEVWECFHIVKVSYTQGEHDFYIDIMALSQHPVFSINSLSINLFLGR